MRPLPLARLVPTTVVGGKPIAQRPQQMSTDETVRPGDENGVDAAARAHARRARWRKRSASTISRDHLLEADGRHPAKLLLRLRGVAQQHVDLGRSHQVLADDDELVHLQADVREGDLAHLANGDIPAAGDDVVVRRFLLQHHPHGAHIVACVSPVAFRVQIAELQFLGEAELDARHPVGDPAGDELDAAQRTLVIEQDAVGAVQTISFRDN